jgi:hypothetical protein
MRLALLHRSRHRRQRSSDTSARNFAVVIVLVVEPMGKHG